jgi:PAS domain S-box-containing protein
MVAGGIFMVSWNTRRFVDNHYLLFLGIAYLFIGLIDFLHTLAYQGMAVFPGYDSNLATQLWIAGRYLEAMSLLAATAFLKRKFNPPIFFGIYAGITGLLLASIFWWDIFPKCYSLQTGLTTFKTGSEYIISLILAATAWVIYSQRQHMSSRILALMLGAVVSTIAAEMFFTLYISVYGISNLIGHLFKIISYYLVYKAIIETNLTKPYETLFLNLKNHQAAVAESEGRLRAMVQTTASVIIYLDTELLIYACNPAAETFFGLSREDMLGFSFTHRLVSPGQRSEVEQTLYGVLAGQTARGVETLMQAGSPNPPTLLWNSVRIGSTDGTPLGVVIIGQDISGHIAAELEKENLIHDLSQALNEIKTLSGLLPICARCKNIRDDQGYWQRIENYIESHSEATFTHGLCPKCIKELYPDLSSPDSDASSDK